MKKGFIVLLMLCLIHITLLSLVYATDDDSESPPSDSMATPDAEEITPHTEGNSDGSLSIDSPEEITNTTDATDQAPTDSTNPVTDEDPKLEETKPGAPVNDLTEPLNPTNNTEDSTTESDKPNTEDLSPPPAEVQPVFDYERIQLKPGVKPNKIFLTFDDGPSWVTTKILDLLKVEGIKATFFVCAREDAGTQALLSRMAKEGHVIGNHTYSHTYSHIYKNSDAFFKDFYKNEKIIHQATGTKPKLVRLPGGSNNSIAPRYGGKGIMDVVNKKLKVRGYTYFDWNASSGDAAPVPPTKEHLIYNVLNWTTQRRSSIVLMHDSAGKATSLKALPVIIEKLKSFGFTFDTLSEDGYHVAFNDVPLSPPMKRTKPISRLYTDVYDSFYKDSPKHD